MPLILPQAFPDDLHVLVQRNEGAFRIVYGERRRQPGGYKVVENREGGALPYGNLLAYRMHSYWVVGQVRGDDRYGATLYELALEYCSGGFDPNYRGGLASHPDDTSIEAVNVWVKYFQTRDDVACAALGHRRNVVEALNYAYTKQAAPMLQALVERQRFAQVERDVLMNL